MAAWWYGARRAEAKPSVWGALHDVRSNRYRKWSVILNLAVTECYRVGLGIDRRQIAAFAGVADPAAQAEIALGRLAVVLLCCGVGVEVRKSSTSFHISSTFTAIVLPPRSRTACPQCTGFCRRADRFGSQPRSPGAPPGMATRAINSSCEAPAMAMSENRQYRREARATLKVRRRGRHPWFGLSSPGRDGVRIARYLHGAL
jgi:hypothetical protein